MTPDVAQTALKAFDVIDFDNYKDGGGSGKSYAPPPEGRYTGRCPIVKDDGTDVLSDNNFFWRSAEGYLQFKLPEFELMDGPTPGYKVKYTNMSSKKFKNREGSQTLDFLRACGIAARPTSETELRAALKMASGRPFQFNLIWEAFNKNADENVSGYENFPVDPADPTKRLPYIKDEFETNKRWFANGKVRYFISALQGKQ